MDAIAQRYLELYRQLVGPKASCARP
jgi:hypothetical protein